MTRHNDNIKSFFVRFFIKHPVGALIIVFISFIRTLFSGFFIRAKNTALFRFSLKYFLGASIVSCTSFGCFMFSGLIMSAWNNAELLSPPPTLIITDRHGRFMTEAGSGDPNLPAFGDETGFWPINPPPYKASTATLIAEDKRFYRHPGVDIIAIIRAAKGNLQKGRRISGASTIAMQIARMQNPGPRTYRKKCMEALTALFLIQRHGHDEVLAHYLRIAPYANRIRGYSYSARNYFDKPVEDLSWAEAALLAALPQGPSIMDPYDPRGRARAVERGRRILDSLLHEAIIESDEYSFAYRQIGLLRMSPKKRRPDEAMHAIIRLSDDLSEPKFRRTITGTPIIRSTVDLDIQNEILSLLGNRIAGIRHLGAGNGAAIAVDIKNAGIVAYIGSTDYFDSVNSGSIDYASVTRSPGSTLKPLLYALSLERGVITPSSILEDLPHTKEPFSNADRLFLGPMLPRTALANSRNVPAMRLQAATGPEEVYSFFGEIRLHDRHIPADHYGAGLSLGAMPVSLENLVQAYTLLVDNGNFHETKFIETSEHNVKRVLSPDTASIISLFLSDPMARLPTFPRMGSLEYSFPVAVKTGTASGYRDAWTVAYSDRYIVGVWIGHPDWQPMNRLTGSNSAAPIVQSIMEILEKDRNRGNQDRSFSPPKGHEAFSLCAITGKRATNACDRTVTEWLDPDFAESETCDAHFFKPYVSGSGLPQNSDTEKSNGRRVFLDPGPRFASWAAGSGFMHSSAGSFIPDNEGNVIFQGYYHEPSADKWLNKKNRIPPDLVIKSPIDGRVIFRDPETPALHSTLALEVMVDPPVEQIVWYVDDQPYRVVEHPYSARWPLSAGEYIFQARSTGGDAVSKRVRVSVH